MIDQEEQPQVLLKIVHAREDAAYCRLLNDILISLINNGQLITIYESADGRELITHTKRSVTSKRISQIDDMDSINSKIDLFVFLRSNDFIKNKSDCKELELVKALNEEEPVRVIPIQVGHFIGGDPFFDKFVTNQEAWKSIEQEGPQPLMRAVISIGDIISQRIEEWQVEKRRKDKPLSYKDLVESYPDFDARCLQLESGTPFEKNFASTFGYGDNTPGDFEDVHIGKETFVVIKDENLWLKAVNIGQSEKILKTAIKHYCQLGARENVCVGVLLYDLDSSKSRTFEAFKRSTESVGTFYDRIKVWASVYEKSGFVMILPLKVFERAEIIDATKI